MPPGSAVCAGLSGGLDSIVLLDILAGLRDAGALVLTAVHVHHGLSPNADAWAKFCEALCRERGVALEVHRVPVDRESPLGLEGAAREARYRVYASQGAPIVALAHHRDDQAETVLLQLLRGTGLKGAAAMPEWRVLPGTEVALLRPMLELARPDLLAHARERGLDWIEDESNDSSLFDRNFLRREVGPLLAGRFPNWQDALARFARHAAGADGLLQALARDDGAFDDEGLELSSLRLLPPERQANVLRAFIEANALPMPSEARLAEMARQLLGARADAQVRIEHGGAALVRHRDIVRVDRHESPGPGWRVAWDGGDDVALGEGRGAVRFAATVGEGIAERVTHDQGWHFGSRDGGERIRLDPARPTRTLKNLLQEHGVPPWQRSRLPLLFHGDFLVWVPGIGVAAGYRCPAGEPGRAPEWLSPGPAAGLSTPAVLE